MTENKALALIGIGVVLLSSAVNAALLTMNAPGELLAVAMAVVLAVAAVPVSRVMSHYEALKQRR